ncbi:pilus assembly protein CpaD [Sphingomonas sp. Leaf407]|uniref:CpaD family pilus assembly protein n=1 Tax=unclassified Sphingomonas TaxID=196159 RepID=UPI0006FB00BA|nr:MULTISPECIES: CpaD family pilus assembly lipoprotein [unclassified Sphingomonas]KQN36593.1 pilus assembly protein CpaD [Sphingomonas sp. Leaf42]KQT27215.1 pilus assembly protein CpaD [Sphingomonas sp. Leaf407]
MLSIRTLALALSGTALLAGCSGTPNRGVESVHQPVVSRAAYAMDLAAGPAGLATGERARLAGWLDTMRLRYGDEVGVDAGGSADPAVRADVAAEAARHGLLLADMVPPVAGVIEPGTVRVVVSRMTAAVPGCPDTSRLSQPNYGAHTSSDFGCAVNTNLAAMVAAPGDLVRGQRDMGTTDTITGTKAIGALRRAAPSGNGGGQITNSVGSATGGSGK